MSARVYFKCSGSFIGSFLSTDGEEYTLKARLELGFYSHREMHLTLEWTEKSSKFIMVLPFDSTGNLMNNHRSFLMQHGTCANVTIMCELSQVDYILIIVYICNLCKPLVEKPAAEKSPPTKAEPKVEKKLEQLSTDMRNLIQTGNLSDVVLTDGTKEIRAHKLILSARSSVFAKMFQHPMKENLENRITIKDVSHEVLLELLNFMYSGIAEIKDSNMARDLYVAGDKYDVKDLRDICSSMLKSIDLSSVLDTLLLADLCGDKVLKDAALNFISKNYSQVKALQKWNSFMKEHHDLSIEILTFVIDKKN